MLTDNRVLVDNLRPLPALMCVQRKAKKKIVTEEDAIRANIDSFGDDIGKTTNRITAMFEVQSKYPKDSAEYQMLDYRIKCGQLFQQNAIDKAKGIIAKPMPREWFDRHHALMIEDEDTRSLYLSILADKKPYFMRYIYPDLMRQYNTYIKNTNKKVQREFAISIDELIARDEDSLTEREREFKKYYLDCMPVGIGDCVINKICRRFEEEFDGYIGKRASEFEFDYSVLKSGEEYSQSQYNAVVRLLDEYNRRVRDYTIFANRERVDNDEVMSHMQVMKIEFRSACDAVCSNSKSLCDILLDVCYQKSCTKNFVWSMCSKEIVRNLLEKNDWLISFPSIDNDGDIEYGGNRFSLYQKRIEVA